jgi:type IV fimbrial biogenesis protein FimT
MDPKRFAGCRGMTMIEVVIAVAILGLLVAIAIPSFNAGKPLRRLKADVRTLASHMKLAKLNAVKRNVDTGLYFNNSGAAVLGVPAQGFCIYEDDGGTAAQLDAADTVVKTDLTLQGGDRFTNLTCPNKTIIFSPDGTATASAGTVTITNVNGRQMDVVADAATGRVHIQ